MDDMRELIPELELIPIERTSPITEKPKPDKKITGRQYRRMLRRWAFAFGVSLGFNIVLAVALWIAQAGPV